MYPPISVQHCDELVEPCTVETLLFTNVWRIPHVVIHKRRVDSKKLGELVILRECSCESGDLCMNFIDVRGWTFDQNIDDQKPEGLLRTSLQAVNKLDNNKHSKLSLGGSKEEWFRRRTSRERFCWWHHPQLRDGELDECRADPTEESLD